MQTGVAHHDKFPEWRAVQRHAKYERLIARRQAGAAARTIVVHPCDETSLRGAAEAAEAGIIVPVLVGRRKRSSKRRVSTGST